MYDGQGRLILSGGEIEVLDLPGDPARPPLVLLHEGLGSVGLWRGFPEWLEVDPKALKGTFKAMPARADLSSTINEHLVIELYSK